MKKNENKPLIHRQQHGDSRGQGAGGLEEHKGG